MGDMFEYTLIRKHPARFQVSEIPIVTRELRCRPARRWSSPLCHPRVEHGPILLHRSFSLLFASGNGMTSTSVACGSAVFAAALLRHVLSMALRAWRQWEPLEGVSPQRISVELPTERSAVRWAASSNLRLRGHLNRSH